MNETTEEEYAVGPKFLLGQVVATPTALAMLEQKDILGALKRHVSGDWGEVCDEDQGANEEALASGERLLSAYTSESGTKFWVITEADRSATTILLPQEY